MNKLLILLISFSAFSRDLTLSRSEETLLMFPDKVLVTNCSPQSHGYIEILKNINAKGAQHVLKFVPRNLLGTVFCSVQTASMGVYHLKIGLYQGVLNPMVTINTKTKSEATELISFKNFVLGQTDGLSLLSLEGSIRKTNFKYKIESVYALDSMHFYKISVVRLNESDLADFIDYSEISNIKYSSIIKVNSSMRFASIYLYSDGRISFADLKRVLK